MVFLALMVVFGAAYHAAWFYAWQRLGTVSPEERLRLRVPNPWRDFSYELFAFTASRKFLRITDQNARRALAITLVLTPVPLLLVLGFWLQLHMAG